MANVPKRGRSMGDWQPEAGGAQTNPSKLMATTAHDDPDCVPGPVNEQKQFEGAKRKPQGPFGTQGKEF